ncbi:elongation factor 1-delta, putative [Entamoeba dispar SAW760]|uniref:Elongation factor 1-delta, putative n=1 Tax=Entamoeba dispar (strain ATCC PRA-260 / SAW760) TaxID=370354 RepID=B0EUL5_ENTDS|nr:elongation factor 1-delta, putative [Entamoeba dispar SAW760]EDR21791.1 elongation factor 1-delta, putative [Entamoeba dispar SAW760]|eukprot:EDR21791.1 elongation factor 1-delta, putative [Entamoeba dispar SAW760]
MADDMDLFGEMTPEEIEAEKKRKEAKEAAKKAEPVGQSQIVYDIKPWGEDTNLEEMEAAVRAITREGLEWKGSERKDVAYGIKKLTIICNVLDSVDTESVQEEIEGLEDYVQSVDIVSFNKL